MNFHLFIELFLVLLPFNYISYVHAATSSSVFTGAIKYKNPKVEKTVSNWKTEVGNDEGSKLIKYIYIYRTISYHIYL